MEILRDRYQSLITALCDGLSAGHVVWNDAVARQGPAILGRAGVCLRGLPALIAWHVAEEWPGFPLAWRLVPAETLGREPRAAALPLPSKGGDGLYAALPDPRPQRLVDGPPQLPEEATRLHVLQDRLRLLVSCLGERAPDLSPDTLAICSLGAAFLRPLGRSRLPEHVSLAGAWTPGRLARVANWARVLADAVVLEHARKTTWRFAPPSGVSRSRVSKDPTATEAWLHALRRSGLVLGALPAELREPVPPEERHLTPERTIRPNIVFDVASRRGPSLGALGVQVPADEVRRPQDALSSAQQAVDWCSHAVLGLALAEHLGIDPLPSDLGSVWRRVGAVLREQAGRAGVPEWLAFCDLWVGRPSKVRYLWHRLVRAHRARAWLHPASGASLRDLERSGRWSREDLSQALAEARGEAWNEQTRWSRVSYFPPAMLASLRRAGHPVTVDEAPCLDAIAAALSCEPRWDAILEAARAQPWARQARPKASGGLRWLDVPSEPLRAAQRVIARLLMAVFPRQRWVTAFHPGASPALHARVHAGARVAVRGDLADFFGSVHPWHLEPWFGLSKWPRSNLLASWSDKGRDALVALLFHQRDGLPYLPQGAPSSPVAANLAGLLLDHVVLRNATIAFGGGKFRYSRYADDLVLSSSSLEGSAAFHERALEILTSAASWRRWRLRPEKTQRWSFESGEPLVVCGLQVPHDPDGTLGLDRQTWRRARAALHRLRLRLGVDEDTCAGAHGLLAYAYAATGELRWLAYSSGRLKALATALGGPLFSEAVLAGWSDEADLAAILEG